MRTVALLALLAVNAIPAAGWFIEGWSAGTTLVVYWFENVAVCLFVAARIFANQRANPRRGHFAYQGPRSAGRGARASFLEGFLVTSLVFSAAHGLFLGVILLVLDQNGQDHLAGVVWHQVRIGCIGVLVVLAIEFAMDLPGLRRWSFWQIEQTANPSLGRIAVVHLTLVLGLFGAVLTDASALFGVFVVLKTLNALSTALPQWEPRTAPKWLSRVMNRLPNARPGEDFEDLWAKERADEAARRVGNEQPWVGTRNA
ncbi:hypothetical protein CIW52_09295 [Mycolicibacterium sp. P9-64]|uniref:DUF6498-containing protein n=1 Tax=Mycolicibacterium sp. P9-64 TaxID=2024612 RepID=UPI0011ED042F|nr:DUF6498-containing protein [Mycolicibacterium sp. P9-64]KAA0084253.1 hypothetical protein CIW52_09295 [Mycolicibacterium sp. P9-64]